VRRGAGGHTAASGELWLIFLAPHVVALPGELDQDWRAGRRGAHMAQAAAPRARVPGALWQQWQEMGIRCSYTATERAFPPAINAEAGPRLSEH